MRQRVTDTGPARDSSMIAVIGGPVASGKKVHISCDGF